VQESLGAPYDFSKSQILETAAPELRGVDEWINTPPLTLKSLRGKVVVLNFWTFGCINCIHNLPHYKAWVKEYAKEPVVLLGIHTPETDEEHDLDKVKKAVAEKELVYPIAIDNRRETWKAWGNDVWPSVYLIDKRGYVRYWWYGELNWKDAHNENEVRQRIRELLAEKDAETP
jgi:thiol-disulfide isomerase/thioredoxin